MCKGNSDSALNYVLHFSAYFSEIVHTGHKCGLSRDEKIDNFSNSSSKTDSSHSFLRILNQITK